MEIYLYRSRKIIWNVRDLKLFYFISLFWRIFVNEKYCQSVCLFGACLSFWRKLFVVSEQSGIWGIEPYLSKSISARVRHLKLRNKSDNYITRLVNTWVRFQPEDDLSIIPLECCWYDKVSNDNLHISNIKYQKSIKLGTRVTMRFK